MLDMLRNWQNFYLLVGTASATLIGLIFIAASLGAGMVTPANSAQVHTWVTPTLIHFGSVLLIAVVMPIPTLTVQALAGLLLIGGVAGLAYAFLTTKRMWHQTRAAAFMSYSDWLWYATLPVISYGAALIGGIFVLVNNPSGLDLVAVSIIILLVLGIRNAWDLMLWIAQNRET